MSEAQAAHAVPAAIEAYGGPGGSGWPRTLLCVLVLALALALGIAFPYFPILPVVVAGAILFFIGCSVSPVWALAAYAFAHVAIPVYLRIPPIGPLPPTPIPVAMLVGLAAASLVGSRPGWTRNIPAGLVIAVVIFDLVALQSLLDPRTGSEGINMWFKVCAFTGLLMLVCLKTLRGPADVERIFGAILLGGVAISIYAIVEFALKRNYLFEKFLLPVAPDWGPLYYAVVSYGTGAYRCFSVFSNPLEFGSAAAMIYPLAMVRFATARTRRVRLIFGLAGAFCVLGVATTFSRGPILSLVLTTVGVGLIQPWSRRLMLVAVPTAAAAVLIGWMVFGHKIEHRVDDVDNVTLRFKLWETAVAMFDDHPWRGVGIGNFPEYETGVIRQHRIGPFYEFGEDEPERTRVAESTYLQLAAETGILGIAAFAGLLLTFFGLLVARVRRLRPGRMRDLYIAIGASAVAYLDNGLTVTAYTHYVTTMLFFGVLLAATLVLRRSELEAEEPGIGASGEAIVAE